MADAHNTPDELGKDERREPASEGDVVAQTVARSFVQTVVECLVHPVRFFRHVAESEERWGALGFAVVMHAVGFSAAAAWKAVLQPEELSLALIRVIIAPLWVMVSVWIGSEIMHGWLKMLRGASRPRSVTHRAVAFCYATAVLGVVPYIGIHLGLAAAAVYQSIALCMVHRAPAWKAVVAVLLTWSVLIGGIVLLFAASGALDEPAS